ncbi:MAG: hypothetical protein JSU95_08830 [Betaproteobacteria bacterium]|nr:MAG: hypothetical protein JSU95_08830 [Betaproteobacteria bacterium]
MNESSTFEVVAEVGRKGAWTVSLNADSLTIAAVDGEESFQIARADAEEKAELRESRLTTPFLSVSIPKKKVVFKLDRAQAASIREWLGPPTLVSLKAALKRRLRWSVPIGILFVLASLPLPANPEAGLEAVPFDPVSGFFGVSLLALSMLTRVWHHRILFLLDGVWFSLLALNVAVGILRGDSPWWTIIVIVLVIGARSGFSEYKRFDSLSSR